MKLLVGGWCLLLVFGWALRDSTGFSLALNVSMCGAMRARLYFIAVFLLDLHAFRRCCTD